MSTRRPDRGRQGRDAGAAARRTQHRVADLDTTAARSYVRLDSNDYSVHPVAVGRRIEVTADLHRVRGWCGGNLLADHDRAWAKHQTISDPNHVEAAKLLRRKHFDVIGQPAHVHVEQRRLADYDIALGLDGPVA
jgi:transposase